MLLAGPTICVRWDLLLSVLLSNEDKVRSSVWNCLYECFIASHVAFTVKAILTLIGNTRKYLYIIL